jgi:hypothetical protein
MGEFRNSIPDYFFYFKEIDGKKVASKAFRKFVSCIKRVILRIKLMNLFSEIPEIKEIILELNEK